MSRTKNTTTTRPTASPSRLPSGAWVLRTKLPNGRRVRIPVAGADASPAEVRETPAALLASWDRVVAELLVDEKAGPTFGDVARDWTSGELARRYPDHVKHRRSADTDGLRLARHVLPVVKDVPIAAFTLDDAERVLARLPSHLSPASRRQVALLVGRVLRLAVYPLRLRESSPIPPTWLPKLGAKKALAWLYPDEEAQLLRCERVPLHWRVLYGFLAREGCRISEARAMRWDDVDLERGVVRLDRNKTDEPRTWRLGDDVVRALAAWRRLHPRAKHVFVGAAGEPIGFVQAASQFREHLRLAGVGRSELFERTAQRLPIRVHDLRASFCTVALAAGRSETWARDRTGHVTTTMFDRYRRQARHAAELAIGWFSPLDEALNVASWRGHGTENANDSGPVHWMPYCSPGAVIAVSRGFVDSDARAMAPKSDLGPLNMASLVATLDEELRALALGAALLSMTFPELADEDAEG